MATCRLCGKKMGVMENKFSPYIWYVPDADPLCESCFHITKSIAEASRQGNIYQVEDLCEILAEKYNNDAVKAIIDEYKIHCAENAHNVDLKTLRTAYDLRKSFMLTTGFGFEGYKITRYLNLASGEAVLGTGLLSELSAAINDVTGTFSNQFSHKIIQAKRRAVQMLTDRCINQGANAVIGVSIDVTTMGQNMIMVSADGTAVFVERIEN